MLKIKRLKPFVASQVADNATGATFVTSAEVGTLSILLTGFTVKVGGGDAWGDASTVTIQDIAGNVFATIAVAALTGNAVVGPYTSGVTLGAAWSAGGAAGSGLVAVPDVEETTGSPLTITVTGLLA